MESRKREAIKGIGAKSIGLPTCPARQVPLPKGKGRPVCPPGRGPMENGAPSNHGGDPSRESLSKAFRVPHTPAWQDRSACPYIWS